MPKPRRFTDNMELTPAELAVVKEAVKPKTMKEIADERGTSWQTVRNQITAAYFKLGVRSRTQALIALYKRGLLDFSEGR